MSAIASRFTAALAKARDHVTIDKTNRLGTGTRFEAHLWIEQATARALRDEVVEGAGHVEEFSVEGRWASHVRKDSFQLDTLYDRVWGDRATPYGFFTITVKTVDGRVLEEPEIDIMVEDPGFEPNDFALDQARAFLTQTVGRIVSDLLSA